MNTHTPLMEGDIVVFQDSDDSYLRGEVSHIGYSTALVKARGSEYGLRLEDIFQLAEPAEYAQMLEEKYARMLS